MLKLIFDNTAPLPTIVLAPKREPSTKESKVSKRILCGKQDCTETFSSERKRRAHFKTHKITEIPCDHCNKSFPTPSKLSRHLSEIRLRKTCQLCHFVALNTSEFSQHLKKVHPDNFYDCNLCPSRFGREESLRRHLCTHKKKLEAPQRRAKREKHESGERVEIVQDSKESLFDSMVVSNPEAPLMTGEEFNNLVRDVSETSVFDEPHPLHNFENFFD